MRHTLSLAYKFLTHAFGNLFSFLRGPRQRAVVIFSGVLIVLCTAIWVHAQTSLNNDASNSQNETAVWKKITANTRVEVRSGGSLKKSIVTGYLNPGAGVEVIRESKIYPGWLEIKPPAGSYSWINSLVVKRYGKYIGAVKAIDPVPTRIGKAVHREDEFPQVENKKRLARGTLLVILADKAVSTKEGSWLPIAPTPNEVRYIPAAAVQGSRDQPAAVVSAKGMKDLIAQADRAFQAGQWCKATEKYLQAAQQAPVYKDKLYCYNQLDLLEKKGGGPSHCLAQPGHPQHASTVPGSNPFRTASKTTAGYRPQTQQTKEHTALSPSAPKWSRWGILRSTRFRHKGQPMYVLTDGRGNVITYAATTTDMTLAPYLNRQVCLYGAIRYQSDDRSFRNHFVMVSHVAVP